MGIMTWCILRMNPIHVYWEIYLGFWVVLYHYSFTHKNARTLPRSILSDHLDNIEVGDYLFNYCVVSYDIIHLEPKFYNMSRYTLLELI